MCLQCTRPHTSTFTNAHTLCHTFVLFYVLSFCSHWAHAGKIKHCSTIWVWTEAEMAEERHSEVPAWDEWRLQFRFLSLAFISVIHILKVMWCKTSYLLVFSTLISLLPLMPMFSFPASMMSSHAFSSSCLSLSFSHLSPYWLLYFSLFHPLCLPLPRSFLL